MPPPIASWIQQNWQCAPVWVAEQPLNCVQILQEWPFHLSETLETFRQVLEVISNLPLRRLLRINPAWKRVPKRTPFSDLLLNLAVLRFEPIEIASLDDVEALLSVTNEAKEDLFAVMLNSFQRMERAHEDDVEELPQSAQKKEEEQHVQLLIEHFTQLAFDEVDLTKDRAWKVLGSNRLRRGAEGPAYSVLVADVDVLRFGPDSAVVDPDIFTVADRELAQVNPVQTHDAAVCDFVAAVQPQLL
jgi:hypothetical protein